MTATDSNLYLHRLEIKDFMGVEHEAITLDGNHAVMRGSNASGKTSRLTALFAALAGTNAREVPEPIRHGADKATVEADLGEYLINLTITGGGPRLTITARDGSKVRRARDLLDGLLGKYSLDIGKWLEQRPQDQVDDVLAICGVKPPVEQVEKIIGERMEPAQGETCEQYMMRLSADETGLIYVRRRDAHRDLDVAKGALKDAREQLQRIGGVVGPDEAVPSTSELMARQQELQAAREKHREAMDAVAAAQRAVERVEADAQAVVEEISRTDSRIDRIETDIAKLKAQLEAERTERVALVAKRDARLETDLPVAGAKLREAKAVAAKLTDPAAELNEIRTQFATVEKQREAIAERQEFTKSIARLETTVEQHNDRHETLDGQLEQLRHLRRTLLEDLDLGVSGLSVSGGELRLREVPLRQCSTREQLEVAFNVVERQGGKLRLLRIDNAERFDGPSWAFLLKEAGRRGWQVVSAAVSQDGGPVKIEIVERMAEVAGGVA